MLGLVNGSASRVTAGGGPLAARRGFVAVQVAAAGSGGTWDVWSPLVGGRFFGSFWELSKARSSGQPERSGAIGRSSGDRPSLEVFFAAWRMRWSCTQPSYCRKPRRLTLSRHGTSGWRRRLLIRW